MLPEDWYGDADECCSGIEREETTTDFDGSRYCTTLRHEKHDVDEQGERNEPRKLMPEWPVWEIGVSHR